MTAVDIVVAFVVAVDVNVVAAAAVAIVGLVVKVAVDVVVAFAVAVDVVVVVGLLKNGQPQGNSLDHYPKCISIYKNSVFKTVKNAQLGGGVPHR